MDRTSHIHMILAIAFSVCLFPFISTQRSNVTVNNTVYSFYKVKVNYDMASFFCRSTGAKLVNIKTLDTQILLYRQIFQLIDFFYDDRRLPGYWVGGRRADRNETWKWSDGSPIPGRNSNTTGYSQYGTFISKHNKSGRLNCLSLNGRDLSAYDLRRIAKWKMSPCNTQNYFICEKELEQDVQSKILVSPQKNKPASTSPSSTSTTPSKAIAISLSAVVLVLVVILIIISIKFKKLKKKQGVANLPQRGTANPYSFHQPLSRPTVGREETEGETDIRDRTLSNSIGSYEMIFSSNSETQQHNPASSEADKQVPRVRGESSVYVEIQDDNTNENSKERSQTEKRPKVLDSPYLDMRPKSNRFRKTKTLPSATQSSRIRV